MVSQRQASKKKPRTYGDYREMLKEKDLDIVLIATPDHWHALPMIAAVEAGADVYVQKPISVDVVEGQAMLAAARKTQARRPGRHAAPQHAAPDRGPRPVHEGRQTRQDRPGRDLLLLPHARPRQPAGRKAARVPRLRDVDRPGADAAVQLARASAPLARLHGIRQRHRRRHVRSHARHGPLDARPRLAAAISSTGGILVDKNSKANITDTQTATFDFGDLHVVWQHRTYGHAGRSEVSLGRDLLRRQGHAQSAA